MALPIGRALLRLHLALALLHLTRGAVPVYISHMELYTTHDWFFERPEVYFQCEGEPKRFLTGVLLANHPYNFTFHESFQPLTELEVPQCKRCGLYEKDFFTEDDIFDKFELCPLDFSEPPEGELVWDAPNEMNITFKCPQCNTRNSFADGVIFSPTSSATANYFFIFAAVLSIGLGISGLVVLAAFCAKEGRLPWMSREVPGEAKFMEMLEDEDDDDAFLDDLDDLDVELADRTRSGRKDD